MVVLEDTTSNHDLNESPADQAPPRRKNRLVRWTASLLAVWCLALVAQFGYWAYLDYRSDWAVAELEQAGVEVTHDTDWVDYFFRKGVSIRYEILLPDTREFDQAQISEIGELMGQINKPVEFGMMNCSAIEDLDFLRGLINLESVGIVGCRNLRNIDGLQGLPKVNEVALAGCRRLSNLDGLRGLSQLSTLYVQGCPELINISGLKGLPEVSEIIVTRCPQLVNLDGLAGLSALDSLYVEDCPELNSIDGLCELPQLTRLTIDNCPHLSSVESLGRMPSIADLDLIDCGGLADGSGLWNHCGI